MAGKMLDGTTTQWDQKTIRAYNEGVEYRMSGTAAAKPVTGNPHDGNGTTEETAWDTGWADAHAIPNTVDKCCAQYAQVATP